MWLDRNTQQAYATINEHVLQIHEKTRMSVLMMAETLPFHKE